MASRDGFIDTRIGEVFDYDGDGKPPYDPATGMFDEDDWGAIDILEDNFNRLNTLTPEGASLYQLFDSNFEGKLCVDLAYNGIQLHMDGRDQDGMGLFDWMDVNQDGDTNDTVSVDEGVMSYSGVVYDDELRALLNQLSAAKIAIVAEPCFSRGLVEDLSATNRVICTATIEDAVSYGNIFIRGFIAALHGQDEHGTGVNADTDGNGAVSMLEAFNYAAKNDFYDEIPQYDDNGDGISHAWPVPMGPEGLLGSNTYLSGGTITSNLVNEWTKSTSGYWEEPHWSLGVLPGGSQSVAIVNPGWKAVVISPSTRVNFPASLTMNDLTVGCGGAGWNTLLLNYFGTTIPLRVLIGMSIQGGGTVMNLSSGLLVENGSLSISGSLNQDGGFTRVENGALDISGSLVQNGGYVQATNGTTYVDGDGAYYLTNGTFQGGAVQLGVDSVGGTNASAWLKVYSSWSRRVKYQLNGGSLNTDFPTIAANSFATGTFEQNGGRHNVANTLTLYGGSSYGGSMPAKYLLSDGILSARFVQLDGSGGYVVFAQTNGTTSVSDTLFLNSGGSMYIGNVSLHGGTLACANVLSQAAGDNILQAGGNFIVTNLFSYGGHISCGDPGFPIYKFNGGTLTASNIDLSAEWDIGSSAQPGRVTNPGYFKLLGTLQISNATERLGRFILASNATINLAGSSGVLSFADSRTENWNEVSLLIVWNWNGLPGGGGAEQLKFGSNQFALTSAQLGRIRFGTGYPTQLTGVRILNTGEVVPAEANPPLIVFARQESNLMLSWPPGWALQSATNIGGFYTDTPNVSSPYTNDMTASAQRFFRLRQF